MPIHFGPRLHAFTHGLFRDSDEAETRELFDRIQSLFASNGLSDKSDRDIFIKDIKASVIANFDLDPNHPQAKSIEALIQRLFDYEQMFVLPRIDWRGKRSVAEWWELRDQINQQKQLIENFANTKEMIISAACAFLEPIFQGCPALIQQSNNTDITISTELIHSLSQIDQVTEDTLSLFFTEELNEAGLFTRLADRLERNLIAASGGNPADPKGFNRTPKPPTKSDIKKPNDLLATYLGGTPLLNIFQQTVDFAIPTASRFEHHHIVAGSGHGKTQTLQFLIAQDLEAVAQGERSVIVLDSQGDLIRNISNLAEFAPGGPLHDRIVIIDPTDVEWPVSLNLFDVGIERLKDYDPLERERLTNSILELYDFVLGTLLSAEMTQKQSVIFRYVTRLMLHIPDATIHTLRELMEPGSQEKFATDIEKLSGTARHFFETEFSSREFEQTKKQVLRRLWGILENQTFERMFSHPRSKLDLFSEMNAGKVILINTAKDLLKEQGTEIFGRFFIAMIAQAAQERATLPKEKRLPTFVYIDEAGDYFDRNIGIILSQARKYNVGMVLAHQYLGQLDGKLQEAMAANTSIKFAGGVSAKDARTFASMLHTDPAFIETQPKGSFAAHIRGKTQSALPLSFPFGFLEAKPQMNKQERQTLQERMRERYAVHYTKLNPETESLEEEVSPSSDSDEERKTIPENTTDQTDTDASDSW